MRYDIKYEPELASANISKILNPKKDDKELIKELEDMGVFE